MPWARSFCPFRAYCFKELLPFQGMLLLGAFGLSARFNRTVRKVFSLFIPHIYHAFHFQNSNHLIIRLLCVTYSVIDWRNVYNIHHAIPHDLGVSLTFFCWLLCRRYRIRLRIKQNPMPMRRKQARDVSVRLTGWNKVFLRLKRTVSWYETKRFIVWNHNLSVV